MADGGVATDALIEDFDLLRTFEAPIETKTAEVKRVILDEDGDILIRAGTREFLVSSKVLILASTVFKAMLKPTFREGNTPRSSADPLHLPLPDDDPQALHTILSITHFSLKKENVPETPDQLLRATILCDKYDMVDHMDVYILNWLQLQFESDSDEASLWRYLRVTLIISDSDEFARVTKQLSMKLTDVRSKEAHSLGIPGDIEAALQRERSKILIEMVSTVETTMLRLGEQRAVYGTRQKLCNLCNRSKPVETKRCGHCRGDEFSPINCEMGTRLAQYMADLKAVDLFPLSRQLGRSPNSFHAEFMLFGISKHACEGSSMCPLYLALRSLAADVWSAKDKFDGLDLQEFKGAHSKEEKEEEEEEVHEFL